MKPDRKERGFFRRRISAADCIEEKEIREEQGTKERGMEIDVCKYRLSSLPITMAFGYILNAMERLARLGVMLETQPKEDTYTHSHIHVESVCHGNPQ